MNRIARSALTAVVAAVATIGAVGGAASVHAADAPSASLQVACTAQGAYLRINALTDGLYVMWIDGVRHPAEGADIFAGSWSIDAGNYYDYGPIAEGTYSVEVDSWYQDGTVHGVVVNPDAVEVDCAPGTQTNTDCGSNGADISVLIADGPSEKFDIFIDGTQVAEKVNPQPQGFTFGPYANGTHTIRVYWYGEAVNILETEIVIDCPDESSGVGAGGPGDLGNTGSNTTPMALTAMALVMAGAGLLMLRRRPAA